MQTEAEIVKVLAMWERKLEEAKAARAERYPETAQELTIKGWISALEWVLEKKK